MLKLIQRLPAAWQVSVLGALVGDALGVPHEFKFGYAIPRGGAIEMVMPPRYKRSHRAVPYGTWSDDGSQLLALLDVLLTSEGGYSDGVFLEALSDWRYLAAYQAGGEVFDVGGQTLYAIEERKAGHPLSRLREPHCGNGSLMRVLPCAALPDAFGTSQPEALRIAIQQSALTHPQMLAKVSCALYVELCWLIQKKQWRDARSSLREAATQLRQRDLLSEDEKTVLSEILAFPARQMVTGSGYVVNTLWASAFALEKASSLSDALRLAIGYGGDTDTTACVTGGLAGLRFGLDPKCREWLPQMQFSAQRSVAVAKEG